MLERPSWIFVCGCGHTGTTILSQILTESQEVYCNFIENGQFLLYNHFKTSKLIIDFEKNCIDANKKIILEKTPRHVWHIDFIRKSILKSKFILTVREPIPTIKSLFERTGNLDQSIRRYQDDTIQILRQKNKRDVMIVKYEDLVKQPEIILQNICQFVEIDFNLEFLDYYKSKKLWFIDNLNNEHTENRNIQVNKPLYRNEEEWIDSKFAKKKDLAIWMREIGNELRTELGYQN